MYPHVLHHGAANGVTGSCHELCLDDKAAVLIDCGLFQGNDAPREDAGQNGQEIDFPIGHIRALVVTHVHIDHVGRIPHLLAAGFEGPILCTEPSALLLPLVLEDAVKVGFTRDRRLLERFAQRLKRQIVAVPCGQWAEVHTGSASTLTVRFRPAGHILGSAYVECQVQPEGESATVRVVFSGDLGAPYTPLLPAPKAPDRADILILESTYGDRLHDDRRERRGRLKEVIDLALRDRGVILVPAFSIGRTQELLYELEELIHRHRQDYVARGLPWEELEIIVDSPLASRFTEAYRQLKPYWDQEAKKRLSQGRHPLCFEQLTTVDSHEDHLHTVAYLKKNARPCIVIAASGMCAGGRIVNYLKALLADERTDVLFVGYQAQGTPGRAIQQYGPNQGYVVLDGQRYDIRARVHTISGYSAHADQSNLVRFVRGMRRHPREVVLVHGDGPARQALKEKLQEAVPSLQVRLGQTKS
ncbi:MBL fold metallo-hydrolase [Desulfuromonas sp. AOP6]|uniref:MBL fold metallo-hydrolase RNA specificity domain-containing protein n=1 Tax=Desulfuromonas sp. AOP6 TaxID=1566351 RepID=UPI001279CA10|nr:MBL fold metallo-hydrolase [Desulfuromonas sp. AOP6]BCA80073.1 MBL fold hydrolase [Desulfuromonas sp. AOP6]